MDENYDLAIEVSTIKFSCRCLCHGDVHVAMQMDVSDYISRLGSVKQSIHAIRIFMVRLYAILC